MPNYGNYRRPRTPIRGPWGVVRAWMHFASWGEADVVGDDFAEEGIVTGPIQVRCPTHGWAPAGIGDYCAHCEQEVYDKEIAKMEAQWQAAMAVPTSA